MVGEELGVLDGCLGELQAQLLAAVQQTPAAEQSFKLNYIKQQVLRICDIFLRIRIRILVFSTVTFKLTKKNYVFAYYFLKLLLHHFSKIKSHKEVTKQ
jgi:hypothetical protein